LTAVALPAPEDFVPRFGAAYAARDAAAMARLCAEDAGGLSLTGGWADGRVELERLWAADFAGALAQSRLVTGKGRLQRLAGGVALAQQRFVLSGITDAEGRDAGRLGAMLSAVLTEGNLGWSAQSLILAPLT
jgi:ketosteroid isomerase-like protein